MSFISISFYDPDKDSIKYPATPYLITLQQKYQVIIGSLHWLAQATRPGLSSITSILANYQNKPSTGDLYTARLHPSMIPIGDPKMHPDPHN